MSMDTDGIYGLTRKNTDRRRSSCLNSPPLNEKSWDDTEDDGSCYTDSEDDESDVSIEPEPVKESILLNLPGEIRNRIYDYVYQGCFVATGHFRMWTEEKVEQGTVRNRPDMALSRHVQDVFYAELSTMPLKQDQGVVYTPLDSWYAQLRSHQLPLVIRKELKSVRNFKHSVSTNLLFTCWQTYNEFTAILYSKSILAFGSYSPVNHMLDGPDIDPGKKLLRRMPVSAFHQEFIRSICIDCKPRGVVRDSESHSVTLRHYSRWHSCSELIAERLTGLAQLNLFIEVPTSVNPKADLTSLSISMPWVKAFMPLKKCKNLSHVNVYLAMPILFGERLTQDLVTVFANHFRLTLLGYGRVETNAAMRTAYEAYKASSTHWDMEVEKRWRSMARHNYVNLDSLDVGQQS